MKVEIGNQSVVVKTKSDCTVRLVCEKCGKKYRSNAWFNKHVDMHEKVVSMLLDQKRLIAAYELDREWFPTKQFSSNSFHHDAMRRVRIKNLLIECEGDVDRVETIIKLEEQGRELDEMIELINRLC